MENGHIPTKNESSRPLKRSYLENPYLCTLATTLFRIIYTFWGVVFDFCSSCRLVGRKECRINRCLAGHPGVLMAAVPILGTKFAFGVLLGTCRRHRISLAPWLILCPRCCYYLLGIQKGADGRVSVRHNSQKKEKLHEEKGYCNLRSF